MTLSPSFTCETPSPTSCTSPATSAPRTLGHVLRKMPARLVFISLHSEKSIHTPILHFPFNRINGDSMVFYYDFASPCSGYFAGL